MHLENVLNSMRKKIIFINASAQSSPSYEIGIIQLFQDLLFIFLTIYGYLRIRYPLNHTFGSQYQLITF